MAFDNEIINSVMENEFFQTIWFFGFLNGALFILILTGVSAFVEYLHNYFKNKADLKYGRK